MIPWQSIHLCNPQRRLILDAVQKERGSRYRINLFIFTFGRSQAPLGIPLPPYDLKLRRAPISVPPFFHHMSGHDNFRFGPSVSVVPFSALRA